MTVYYNRLNQRAHQYRTINTNNNEVVPSPAQPNPRPPLQPGLSLNETDGTGNGATDAEQGKNTAGG